MYAWGSASCGLEVPLNHSSPASPPSSPSVSACVGSDDVVMQWLVGPGCVVAGLPRLGDPQREENDSQLHTYTFVQPAASTQSGPVRHYRQPPSRPFRDLYRTNEKHGYVNDLKD